MNGEIRKRLRRSVEFIGERMIDRPARAVDEINMLRLSAVDPVRERAVQHCDHRRDTNSRRYKHNGTRGRLVEYECTAWRLGLDHGAGLNVFMEPRRRYALALHRDPIVPAIMRLG